MLRLLPRLGRTTGLWTKEQEDLLLRLWCAGYTMDLIADAVGRTITSVAQHARVMDLPGLRRIRGRAEGEPLPIGRDIDRDKKTPRPCNRCGKPFLPWGAGNHRCPSCALAIESSGYAGEEYSVSVHSSMMM